MARSLRSVNARLSLRGKEGQVQMKTICKQYRTKLVLFGLLQINCKESFLVSTYRLALAGSFCLFLLSFCSAPYAIAQESPYFVAYDHYLEEPGNLEIEYFSTFGTQREGTTSTATGRNSNTARPPGGPRKSTWMARLPPATARCSPVSVGRIASGL